MDNRKTFIMDALRAFVAQRPGFDPRNYDRAGYRSDSRRVTQQRHDFERLAQSVETLDEITADDLIAAFPRAFSGRLTLEMWAAEDNKYRTKLDYCTGQYWCTEYRAAACAVLASALWDCQRKSMPKPCGYAVREWGNRHTQWGPFATRAEGYAELKRLTRQHSHSGESWGTVDEQYAHGSKALSAGDWLRASFRNWFGRGIQSRWFN